LQLYAKTSSQNVHWSNGSEEERRLVHRGRTDVSIFAKVLLKSIEYFWAQKVLPIPVSIPSDKVMGHTGTNTIKVLPILYCLYFFIPY